MKRWLDEKAIRLDVQVPHWEAAVEEAGRLLVDCGAVTPAYVEAMVNTVQELGPYIVIAPGIALPHARPETGALRSAISLVRLRPAIPFGNPDLDPVDLVVGLAAVDGNAHIELMAALARALSDPTTLAGLRNARNPSAVIDLLKPWAAESTSKTEGKD